MTDDPRDMNEQDDLGSVADLLKRARPVPAAGFRARLRHALMRDPRLPRPAGLRLLIAVYGGTGALLLAVAALGVAGTGPLAA